MREFERIDRILLKVKRLWEFHPDQRLGQLLQNYIFGRGDIFFPEDDETEKILDGWLNELSRKTRVGKERTKQAKKRTRKEKASNVRSA